MKTKKIKDIATEYYARHAFTGQDRAFAEIHFEEGAYWMQAELTRWHDPTVELPEDAKTVLVKYVVPGESSTYYTTGFYLHGRGVMPDGWMTAVKVISGVIGWREIHEE